MANTRIETLRAGYEAFNRRDVENALQMFEPHVEWPDMQEEVRRCASE